MDAYTIEIEKNMKKLEKIGLRYGGVEKSIKPGASQKIIRAHLVTKASLTPEGAAIAQKIMNLERQRTMAAAYGLPIQKAMGIAPPVGRKRYQKNDDDEDEWSRQFSPAVDEELTDEDLLAELRRRGYTFERG